MADLFGTSDPPKPATETVDIKRRLKAVEKLLQSGDRGSEWHEAGLLHAIEQIVIYGVPTDSQSLKALVQKARRF